MDGASSGSSLQLLAKLLSDSQEDDDNEPGPHCSVSTMTPGNIGPAKKETTGTFQVKSEDKRTIWNTEEVPEGSEFDDTWDPREQPDSSKCIKENGPKGKQMAGEVNPELLDRFLTDMGIIIYAYEHWRREKDFPYSLSSSLEKYQILFKQSVGTEDVFFGMSRKDPSTACCEDIVVKIKLPETKYSDITLDIRDKILDLRTPKNYGSYKTAEKVRKRMSKKLLLHLPYQVDSENGKARFLSEEETLEVTLRASKQFDFINFA